MRSDNPELRVVGLARRFRAKLGFGPGRAILILDSAVGFGYPEAGLESRSTKARVLFVDDDTRITHMAEQALRAQGFDVTALTSPSEALTLFLTDPREFDAVVLDHSMPGLSGLELAQRISGVRRELPIVLLSGFAEGISRSALKGAGISECLPKPLPLSRLAELVHALLERTA